MPEITKCLVFMDHEITAIRIDFVVSKLATKCNEKMSHSKIHRLFYTDKRTSCSEIWIAQAIEFPWHFATALASVIKDIKIKFLLGQL